MSGFSINRVTITGNLTKDPEWRDVGDSGVCKLRIAAEIGRSKDEMGDWVSKSGYFDVSVWGGVGKYIAGNVSKGESVVVDGKLSWREWETDDGQKRQAVDIVVDSGMGACIPRGDRGGATRSDVPSAGEGEFEHKTPAGATAGKAPGGDDHIPF